MYADSRGQLPCVGCGMPPDLVEPGSLFTFTRNRLFVYVWCGPCGRRDHVPGLMCASAFADLDRLIGWPGTRMRKDVR